MSLPEPILKRMPTTGPLVDSFGRVHTYLRASVTDRCNYRCTYCMPAEGFVWKDPADLLGFEELTQVVRAFVKLGIRRVRLTGGEPLIRKGLPHLIAMLSALGLDDLSMTTNGHMLPRFAVPLAKAGLKRVNVSCDAIDPVIFRDMTRNGDVSMVLAGIDAAREAGLAPIKINAVMVRGKNDHQAAAMIDHFSPHAANTEVRFIEYMPFRDTRRLHLPGAELRELLSERYTLEKLGGTDRGPSVEWRVVETGLKIGFISPITEHFCDSCNRLRLMVDGHLRTCLSRDDTPSLRDLVRAGASDEEVMLTIRQMVWGKVAGHGAHLDEMQPFEGVMTQIGG